MKKATFLGVLGCVLLLNAGVAHAGSAWDELTPDQQAQIRGGEQVFVTQDVSTSQWPKTWVYQAIDATPEQVAAVYFDYEAAKTYVPNVKKSQISKRIDARTVEVDYTLNVPLFPDEDYTVRNALSAPAPASYRIDWTLIRATSTKSSVGNVRIEPLGSETLFAYYTFVVPGSSFAGLLKSKALKQVRDTVSAVGKQVEKERTSDQPTLQKEIDTLRAALSGAGIRPGL